MAAYLDTGVVVSLFVVDAHSQRAMTWLRRGGEIAFSDWTLAEFSSVIATANRAGRVASPLRLIAEQSVNQWVARRGAALAVLSEDVRQARTLMKLTAEPLRASDALHLLIARRTDCSVATFDQALRRAALDLGMQADDL